MSRPARARVALERFPRIRLGAVLALALAAAFVVWLALRGDGDQPSPTRSSEAVAASVGELRSLAGSLGHPLYWAGQRSGSSYELTQTPEGRVFVRYLPADVEPGDPRAAFLTVGTYPLANAFATVQAASRRDGAVTLPLPGGGLAVYDRARPTSVYFATPGSRVQVEVYDPDPDRARQLVLSGHVRPVGAPVSETARSTAASVGELRSLAGSLGHPLYWAGQRSGSSYELTQTPEGRVFVRYLPADVEPGDPRAAFLTVGTYPLANAFATVQAASHRDGAVTLHLPGGGLAVYDRARPTSVYFATPGSPVQVEVYDPDPDRARQLVLSGHVRPVK